MNRKYHVVAGPYRLARKYAKSQGWRDDQFVIVTRGHQLAALDPQLMLKISLVQVHTLGQAVYDEIRVAIEHIRALWSVPMEAAA